MQHLVHINMRGEMIGKAVEYRFNPRFVIKRACSIAQKRLPEAVGRKQSMNIGAEDLNHFSRRLLRVHH